MSHFWAGKLEDDKFVLLYDIEFVAIYYSINKNNLVCNMVTCNMVQLQKVLHLLNKMNERMNEW
jgi:hypothetical protein